MEPSKFILHGRFIYRKYAEVQGAAVHGGL